MPAVFGMTPKNLAKALNLPVGDSRMAAMFEVHHRTYCPDLENFIQAVYGILDTLEGGIYVGSSGHCHQRRPQHDYLLRSDKHHCDLLQQMCARIDDIRWRFVILEEVDNDWELTTRETWWRYNVKFCIDLEDRRRRWELGPLLIAARG